MSANTEPFIKCIIKPDNNNLFGELSKSVVFEDIANGRKGAILVDDCSDGLIPIVRTTTEYKKPAQKFCTTVRNISSKIKEASKLPLKFNNAMIETYDYNYRTMGFHSDQALDLSPNSYICLFSCYEDDSTEELRTLVIKDKISGKQCDISLEHNSIVLWNLETNAKYLHKIILNPKYNKSNKWLGITFRLSKTFIRFIDELPYIQPTNTQLLTVATNEGKRREFYKLRAEENKASEYKYPELDYTISVSDTLPVL